MFELHCGKSTFKLVACGIKVTAVRGPCWRSVQSSPGGGCLRSGSLWGSWFSSFCVSLSLGMLMAASWSTPGQCCCQEAPQLQKPQCKEVQADKKGKTQTSLGNICSHFWFWSSLQVFTLIVFFWQECHDRKVLQIWYRSHSFGRA